MRFSKFLFLGAAALPTYAAFAEDWRSRSIYQVMTDRFALGNGTNPPCNPADKKYCGGNWHGISHQLDYIQSMGFDAIWISPVSTTVNSTNDGEAYHGYWTGDLDTLNSNFGDDSDLKELVSELHAREMFLLLDVNVNNMASNSTPANVSYLLPFMNETNYHRQCSIDDPTNQWELENCWIGDGKVLLPDLNTESPLVIDMLNTWIKDLVGEYNIDGLRIASANNVRKDFWPAFAANASVFTIGEVVSNDTTYSANYTTVLDSVIDYPTYYQAKTAFSSTQGNLSALAAVAKDVQTKYKSGSFSSGSFVENHNEPRFQSLTEDQALVKNALAWTFVTDAMPIVYYGQEQGLSGAEDPDNREALWLTGFNPNKPLVSYIASLNSGRKAAAIPPSEFHTTAMKVLSATTNTLAISKPPMLALLSNGGNSSTPSWNVTGTGYEAGTKLVDVLSCNTVDTDGNGNVAAHSKDGLPLVLLPESAMNVSSLCGYKSATVTNAASCNAGLSHALTTSVAVAGLVTLFSILELI